MTHTQEKWAAGMVGMARQHNNLLTAMHNAQKAFAEGKTICEIMVILDEAIIEAEK